MRCKPWCYWKGKLSKRNLEAFPLNELPDNLWHPNEIFDRIIEYRGGLAHGHEVRSLIHEVYGVDLRKGGSHA